MEQNSDGHEDASVEKSPESVEAEGSKEDDKGNQQKLITESSDDGSGVNDQEIESTDETESRESGSSSKSDLENVNTVGSGGNLPVLLAGGENAENVEQELKKKKEKQENSSDQVNSENHGGDMTLIANRADENGNTENAETEEEPKNNEQFDDLGMGSNRGKNQPCANEKEMVNTEMTKTYHASKRKHQSKSAQDRQKKGIRKQNREARKKDSSSQQLSGAGTPTSSKDDSDGHHDDTDDTDDDEDNKTHHEGNDRQKDPENEDGRAQDSASNSQSNEGNDRQKDPENEDGKAQDSASNSQSNTNTVAKTPVYARAPETGPVGNNDTTKTTANSGTMGAKVTLLQQATGSSSQNPPVPCNHPKCPDCAQRKIMERLERWIVVRFYVALSPNFSSCTEKYELRIHFFSGRLRGQCFPMKPYQEISDAFPLFLHELKFQLKEFENVAIAYKYEFVNKYDMKEKPHFENSSLHKNDHCNRHMDHHMILRAFESNMSASDEFVWDQFDGITRPSKSFLESFMGLFRWSIKDPGWFEYYALLAQWLMPNWEGLCLDSQRATSGSAEEALKRAQHVYNCITHFFLTSDGREFSKNEAAKLVRSYVSKLLETAEHELAMDSSVDKKCRFGLATFVSIVHIMKTCDVELDKHSIELICYHLLPKPDLAARTCADYDDLLGHFKSTSKGMTSSLLKFVNEDASKVSAEWILVLPLIHFLCNISKPFEDLSHIQKDCDDKLWWGETVVQDAKRRYYYPYEKGHIAMAIEQHQKELVELFEVDKMLSRTLLALIDLKHVLHFMPQIPFHTDASLANIRFFIKSKSDSFWNVGRLKEICTAMAVIAKRIEEEDSISLNSTTDSKLNNSQELYMISNDLMDSVCKQARREHWEMVLQVTEIVLASAKRYSQLLVQSLIRESSESDEQKPLSAAELLDAGKQRILQWLKDTFNLSMDDRTSSSSCFRYDFELRTISNLIKLEGKLWEDDLKNDWRETFEKHLKNRIMEMKPEAIVDLAFEHNFSNYDCSILETIFSDCAQEAVHVVSKEMNMNSVMSHIQQNRDSGKMSQLLSKVFLRTWPDVGSDSVTLLKHVLSGPSFVAFLGAFDNWKSSDNNCWKHIEDGMNKLKDTLRDLANGKICIQELNILTEPGCQKQLLAIISRETGNDQFSFLPSPEGVTADCVLKTLLDCRKKELDEYCHQLHLVKKFLTNCEEAKSDDVAEVSRSLFDDINLVSLGKVCKTKLLEYFDWISVEKNSDHSYHPKISRFRLLNSTLRNLKEFSELSRSTWFCDVWNYYLCNPCFEENLEEDEDENVIHDDDNNDDDDDDDDDDDSSACGRVILYFIKSVYLPSKKHWLAHRDRISSGSVLIKQMEHLFNRLGKDPQKLKSELKFLIKDNDALIEERLDQVKLLQEVKAAVNGAEVILKAKEKFKITGDFSDLEVLQNMSIEKSGPLSAITQTLLKNIGSVKDIRDDQAKCLQVFMENKVLADWLKETVATNEHKTFIDLALIAAANEGAVQVEYINCLDAVVKGFAPLIYEIEEDINYEDFLKLCSDVWDALRVTPDLPDMFEEAARNLDFLKQIQSGLTGDGAIALTQFINRTGIFTVGFHEEKSFRDTMDVINVKYHRVQKKDGTGEKQSALDEVPKHMNWKQLTDLYNKLMLIVGQDEDVKLEGDKFCQVFDGILRLSKTYIKLCTSGCMLFHHWKAIFFCDPGKANKVYVDFGDDDLTLKSGESDVIKNILEICQFMESCLEDWLLYVREQREEFCYLNFFTTQQLMILQRELSRIRNYSEDDVALRNILSLLSLVKKDCTRKDVCESISTDFLLLGKAKVDKSEEVADQEDLPCHHEDEEEEDEATRKFIAVMIDSDFSRELALRALGSGIDPTDVEDGILWCMENQDMNESLLSSFHESSVDRSVTSETDSNADSELESTQNTEATSLVAGTSKLLQALIHHDGTLLGKLRDIWKGFLDQTTESYSDCLSLKHVGLILKNLAEAGDEHLTFSRPLPTYLKTSQPNLILCNKSDVLSAVLSIYAFNGGVDLPLPNVDEVLLCSSETTAEEVELLFRRAIENKSKIYSLVFIDLLDYDVACQVEEQMLRFFPMSNSLDLRLVVICCTEHRSNIVSALDRYRVQLPQVDNNELKRYLRRHFTSKALGEVTGSASDKDINVCNVRMIQSNRSGVGKTLYVKRLKQTLLKNQKHQTDDILVTVSLHSKIVDHSKVMKIFMGSRMTDAINGFRIFHIDVAPEVQEGVDHLLFSLLVLDSVVDENGFVWRRRKDDLYIVECMPLFEKALARKNARYRDRPKQHLVHQIFSLLPSIMCWSPQDSLDILHEHSKEVLDRHPDSQISKYDPLVDMEEFSSEDLQRPFQYLKQYSTNQNVKKIKKITQQGTPAECIEYLLRHCGVEDPSWSELHNFANFLNVQLKDCENSIYCSEFLSDDLPGFLNFVIKFMIRMSKDFATRSLEISEETPGSFGNKVLPVLRTYSHEAVEEIEEQELLQRYSMKRRWETSPHPYLFFNFDRNSFTFMGFVMDRHTQNLLDPQTRSVIEKQIMPQNLNHALYRNNVNLQEDFESLPRDQKISKLCYVMGQDFPHDPDESYELTGDNVKKILAIYMRFRCNIPVIIMGETGCGKTRLIKFMCDLWRMPGEEMENLILMKMHGGITEEDIMKNLENAVEIAKKNRKRNPGNPKLGTVLFFDEANTTEAVGLIKEIMCDRTCNGKPLPYTDGLHLIAACNPYRKHSDVMIDRLEQAGLGYRVRADETKDKFGYIPLRQLVYRVQALPQSMLPLVWDFGQLNDQVESLYIRQMVIRHLKEMPELNRMLRLEVTVTNILAASQAFMRCQKDECSFVSLRDVERTLQVMMWFYAKGKLLFQLMDEKRNEARLKASLLMDEEEEEILPSTQAPSRVTRSLILALGVCYHACLQNRAEYRKHIAQHFVHPCALSKGAETILEEIDLCQDIFLDNIGKLGDNIARNKALKENVFMMVVCIELRIPLFLVGKPGSSKSLAKTIVGNGMLGKSSTSELFKTMKSVLMVSFQCSPLSTPEGIIGIFEQCARLQKQKDLNKNVAVVVLDEVGLAEDSQKMPLKTLHPLLEYGCEVEGKIEPYSRVGFIGISNWALDPAKMNRGILVLREVPDEQELLDSAKGICTGQYLSNMAVLLPSLTNAYEELYSETLKRKREFFGLRDFYSLVKMVYAFCKKSEQEPTWNELKHAIMRNFDGLVDTDALKIFERHLSSHTINSTPLPTDPDCSPSALIKAGLHGIGLDSESRYLLILTENYVALNLLHQQLEDLKNAVTIFGSSFPKDQAYIQVCRNINKIKMCMENGRTVVLLNLENLYESLYDALNQYYMYFNKQRFVDLGLGTQRVKCKVHENFRLIVVAEKKVVYEKFPIPLINRLEKHILSMQTMLMDNQMKLVEQLKSWAVAFCDDGSYSGINKSRPAVGDVFIGYHDDTPASVILQLWKQNDLEQMDENTKIQILSSAKSVLLQCATPDSLIRLSKSCSTGDAEKLYHQYFVEQCHSNLAELLKREFATCSKPGDSTFMQITTHSHLLSRGDLLELSQALGFNYQNIHFHSLQGFDTEQQFCSLLGDVFKQTIKTDDATVRVVNDTGYSALNHVNHLFILQCDSGDVNAELIACARYNIFNEHSQFFESQLNGCRHSQIGIVFIIQLPRIPGGCFAGFQGGKWKCFHLDELLPAKEYLPNLSTLMQLRISELLLQQKEFSDDPDSDERTDEDGSTHRRSGDDALRKIEEELLKFDVNSLILSCLHRSVSLLKDSGESAKTRVGGDSHLDDDSTNRKFHRLTLLLKLLSNSKTCQDEMSLMNVIKRRLGRLVRDKETSHQMPERAGNWLHDEVSTLEATTKAGTFRRSLLQTIESKVTPLLSGIIAYIDKNANLDLLQSSSPWKQKLWFNMLNEEVMLFRYRDLNIFDLRHHSEFPEFHVTNTGCDGQFFQCLFPFSWVVKDQIDCLIHQAKQSGKLLDDLAPLLEATELGRVLRSSIDEELRAEAIDAYLTDFVNMIFKSGSSSQIKCVTEELKSTMQTRNSPKSSLSDQFVEIHLAYDVVRPRILKFAEFVCMWPQCSQFLDKENDETLLLDLRMLSSILHHLIPDPPKKDNSKVDESKYWSDWAEKADAFYPMIQQLIDSFDLSKDDTKNWNHFETCCQRWNQLHALQLFVKRVYLSRTTNQGLVANSCGRLFMVLGKNADFKQIKTFQNLETFMKSLNKQATEFFINLGQCNHCRNPVTDPVELPCKHIVCLKCIQEMKELKLLHCLQENCNKKFSLDLKIEPLARKRKEVIAHNEYRKCLNSFFMGVIHSLCFLRGSPPAEEVVKKLMEFVTLGAKETFEEKADPLPIVRSFVLQVLLQSKIEDVQHHLDEYFEKAKETLKNKEEEFSELCILIVNCLEDYYRSHGCAKNSVQDEVQFVSELLDSVKQGGLKFERASSASVLESFGKIRFILSRASMWIHQMHILDHKDLPLTIIQSLLMKLYSYLQAEKSKWPGIYLMRVICNDYGLEVLRQLSAIPALHWILPSEARKEFENLKNDIRDKFVIYGTNYKNIRNQILLTTLGNETDPLTNLLSSCEKTEKHLGQLMLLALYRSITLSHRHSAEKKLNNQEKESLLHYCAQLPSLSNSQELLVQLIENRLPGSMLSISSDKSPRQLTLAELAAHFYIVMSTLKEQKFLLPFTSLIFNPAESQNSLLPTMPQDDLEKFKSLLAQTENAATVYKCPNGHPYIIGDCGNPHYVRQCPECGLEIGGMNYVLKPGNIKLSAIVDETRRGHCIGVAGQRGDVPVGERDLAPVEAAFLRLLLHLSMYLGSVSHSLDVCELIIPRIPEEEVEDYFRHHVAVDLRHIGIALGKNEDDVFLLVHLLLRQMTSRKPLKSGPPSLPVLVTKEERQQWENLFTGAYITPVLEMLNCGTFSEIQDTVCTDDNLFGNSPLIQMLYEVGHHSQGSGDAGDISHLWRFRAQISLENLAQQLGGDVIRDQNQEQHAILRLFLREKHRLRLLRFLPSVVKLNRLIKHHMLMQQNRETASRWTVGCREFKESFSSDHHFEEIHNLIKDFAVAWKALRQDSFVSSGSLRLTDEHRNQSIDGSTKIATFLPSSRGDGLHSVALISYLCDIQNQFMEKYSQITHKSLETIIDVDDASISQVIMLHEQQDVLPLLLANSAYSLKAGEGTAICYDFASLEKQIEEQFIRGKPRLRPYQVDQLIALDEGSFIKLFKQLNQRIPQEPLPSQLRTEVYAMKKDYSGLNSLAADLETALGYLAFIGGKPTQSLLHFMSSVLKMEPKLKSTKVQTICLKHFESLWLAVTFIIARHGLSFNQEPFEAVDGKYREMLTSEMSSELKSCLSVVKDIDLLSMSLYECIVFHITVRHSDADEANCEEKLDLILNTYIEQKTGTSMEWELPDEVKVKHCLDVWKHLVLFQSKHIKH